MTFENNLLNRRQFLARSAAFTAVALTDQALFLGQANAADITQPAWKTLGIVQARLWPSDGNGPGAADINALAYLYQILQAQPIDPEDKTFILEGVGWLEGVAQQQHQQTFSQLTTAQQEALLQFIAQSSAGERWLSRLLSYIFEALLSDPVYGGNPQQIGWRWLNHTPGFPRPPQPYYQGHQDNRS